MLVQSIPYPTSSSAAQNPLIISIAGANSIDFASDSRVAGFNPLDNTIEMIAGGGDGAISTGNGNAVKGGGGGQYAKITNFDPADGVISFHVGVHGGTVGTAASPGTADSWFDDAASTLYAQGGTSATNGITGTGVAGGAAAAVGSSTVHNGGSGGDNALFGGGAGGGGAGGPSGAGGSAEGGAGNGGDGAGGAGGSADASAVSGGAGGQLTGTAIGADGSTESVWGSTGPGSGGGGGARKSSVGFNAGNGGNYGGGGGGAGYGTGTTRAHGGSGILVISWTP